MDVIRKLQVKYIVTIIVILVLVFTLMTGAVVTVAGGYFSFTKELLVAIFKLYAGVLALSLVLAWLFSVWAVKPVRRFIQKQKRFIGDASHELRTPLASISVNLDVLEAEAGDSVWIDYIRAEVRHMNTLVGDLLAMAKVEGDTRKRKMAPFNLSESIANALLPYDALCYEKKRTLVTDIQPDIIVTGDEQRIQQVAIIFLDNAIKYSDEGAVITVSLALRGKKRVLSVRNTGEGIASDEQSRIFERFYRVDSSHNRSVSGFGLGLSIADTIAKQHHAKLTMQSEPGEYVEFSFIL